jgi:hypothetical protein
MPKSKFQKKKDRERRVKKQLLGRRERLRAEAKEKRECDREERNVRPRQDPIRNEEFRTAQRLRDIEIKMQLEHNMKILQALQEEYEVELKKRKEYITAVEGLQDDQPSLIDIAKKQLENNIQKKIANK